MNEANFELTIDASAPGDRYLDILDELNGWKIYNLFRRRPGLIATHREGWMHDLFPWIDYIRCPAILGGNYGPSIGSDCRERRNTKGHEGANFWECGTIKGNPGLAERYEIVRRRPGNNVHFEFHFFDVCINNLLQSGMRPHLNISSANEWFTDSGSYRYYHWNERPVVHFDRWRGFVRAVFQHLSESHDIRQWRMSCVNEPNCEKRDRDGKIYKVGYQGDEHDYARQYAETLEEVRLLDQSLQFQMGNYVIRPDFMPPIKELTLYLGELKRQLDIRKIPFDAVSFQSLSMYEVPYQTIYGSTATRFDKLRRWLIKEGIPQKPFKIDEFEIHPEIKDKYDAEHRDLPIDTTHYAASWTAKAVKAFQEQGVVSAAGWFGRFGYWRHGEWEPYPKYYVSAFFPLLSGRIAVKSEGGIGKFRRLPVGEQVPWMRLPVAGEELPLYENESVTYQSMEAIATSSPDCKILRILLFRHDTRLESDADVRHASDPKTVAVKVTGLQPGATYSGRAYCVSPDEEVSGAITWNSAAKRTAPFEAVGLGTFQVSHLGTITVDRIGKMLIMNRLTVFFIELQRI